MSGAPLRAGGPHYYRLAPDSNVGGEVYERELLRRLPDQGIELVLGLPSDHCIAEPRSGWEIDVLPHRLGLHWLKAPVVFTPYSIRLIRSGRVDLLRGHSVRHTGPALLAARALTRSRIPIVLHHHHLYPRWARLEAAIARAADAVVTVSEHSRAELIAAGAHAGRVYVVAEGVERPPPTHGDAAAWPETEGLRLLHLGRLEPRKRPEVAIDALAGLARRRLPASLVIAGEGPSGPELRRRAAEAGVGDRVRFAGRVSERDKWRLYDSADVLLFASTLEGFGLVIAEAQSRGTPVIAAAGSATAEAFEPGSSGFLADADGEAFAAELAKLAEPGVRDRMSARAREFAERFDWDACAAQVADIYRSMVSR